MSFQKLYFFIKILRPRKLLGLLPVGLWTFAGGKKPYQLSKKD